MTARSKSRGFGWSSLRTSEPLPRQHSLRVVAYTENADRELATRKKASPAHAAKRSRPTKQPDATSPRVRLERHYKARGLPPPTVVAANTQRWDGTGGRSFAPNRLSARRRAAELIGELERAATALADRSRPDRDLHEVLATVNKLWATAREYRSIEQPALMALISNVDRFSRVPSGAEAARAFLHNRYPEYFRTLALADITEAFTKWRRRKTRWKSICALARRCGLSPPAVPTLRSAYSRFRATVAKQTQR